MHNVQTVLIPAPVSATEISYIPSQNEWSRLISLFTQLYTGATAGNRDPMFSLQDPNGNTPFITNANPGNNIGANSGASFVVSKRYSNHYNGNYTPSNSALWEVPWLDEWIPPGWSITTVGTGLQVGDRWSASVGMFEFSDDAWDRDRRNAAIEAAYQALAAG